MPDISRFSVPVPRVTLPTFIFGDSTSLLPDQLAFADAEEPSVKCFTYAECRTWSKRFAVGLLASGFRRGDRLLVSSPNNVFYPIVYLGTIMAGGIYTAANAKNVPRELAFHLKDSGARVMLVADENLHVALKAAQSIGMNRSQIYIFNDAPLCQEDGGKGDHEAGVLHWKHLIASPQEAEGFDWESLSPPDAADTTAALSYSSGTTGLPKGIVGTHYNFVANAVQTGYMMDLDLDHQAQQRAFPPRWLCVLPVYHGYEVTSVNSEPNHAAYMIDRLALTYFMIIALKRRIPWYCMKQYELNRFLDNIGRHQITDLHLVPPIMIAMTRSPRIHQGEVDLSRVRTTLSSAAPLGAEVTRQYESLWENGTMNVKQWFAMGEYVASNYGWTTLIAAGRHVAY